MIGLTVCLLIIWLTRRVELFVLRVFVITQQEDDLSGFRRVSGATLTWCEPIGCQPWAIELPAWPFSTTSGASQPRYGPRKASRWVSKPASGSEQAKKAKWSRRSRYSVLWINHPVLDLHLADRIVALEVGGIIHGIPQAELDGREDREIGRRSALVGQVSCQISRFSPSGTK